MSQVQSNVISMLELSVKNQQEQSNTLANMLGAIKEATNKAENAADKAEDALVKIQELAVSIENDIRLKQSEVDDLYNMVVKRSINIAKSVIDEEDEDFKTVVGRVRRRIWSEMKKRFGVSKYIFICHKDFPEAMKFAAEFSIKNYI